MNTFDTKTMQATEDNPLTAASLKSRLEPEEGSPGHGGEDRSEKLIAGMIEGFYRSTSKGRFLQVNQAMVNILGYDSIEDLLAVDIIKDLYFNSLDRRISQVDKSGISDDSFRMRKKDGSEIWVEASDFVVRDSNGEELYREGFLRDISKRKLAEQALQANEERYRLLTENSSDVIWVLNLKNKRYVYMSPAIYRLRGLTVEEALGESLDDSLTPESLALVSEILASTYPEFIKNPDYPFYRIVEIRQPHKNGMLICVEISIRYRMNAENEAEVVGVSRDITDRKETEAALQESETRFKALHNASFGGIMIHDKGLILEFNQGLSAITGYSPAELTGMDGLLLLAEESRPLAMEKIHAGCQKPYEAIGVRKNGEKYPLRLESRNIPYKGREVRTTEFRDISESKRAYEIVTELLAEKDLILKEVHHRIKNNMNTMAALLRLQSDGKQNPETKRILQDASARIKSMMVLYDKLYLSGSYSKVSIAEYLPSLAREIVDIFPDGVSVKIEIKAEEILFGAKLLSTLGIIVNELITNSMKYAFPDQSDKVILVDVCMRGPTVCLEYSDNGVGLPQDGSFKNPAGFGMQLIQMLVEQISGSMRLEHKNGTKYSFEFELS